MKSWNHQQQNAGSGLDFTGRTDVPCCPADTYIELSGSQPLANKQKGAFTICAGTVGA